MRASGQLGCEKHNGDCLRKKEYIFHVDMMRGCKLDGINAVFYIISTN